MPTHTDAETLLQRVLRLSVPLHGAIAAFDERGASYRLAGAPGVALFRREAADTVTHVSGTPSPALAAVLDDLHARHLSLAGLEHGIDNSHVPALILLCLYLADDDSAERLGLRTLARRPASIEAIDEEAGRHDPELAPHDAAMRAWTPLEEHHVAAAGVHTAVLDMRFHVGRHERYAPW